MRRSGENLSCLLMRTRNPAIDAFEKNNPEASKDFHRTIMDEPHQMINIKRNNYDKYVQSALFSAGNGILNSCVVVGCITGLKSMALPFLSSETTISLMTLFIGVTTLLCFGFLIGSVDWITKTEYRAFYHNEKKREIWECDNFIEGEQKEMIQLYISKGLSEVDAEAVINILSRNKAFFVDVMMKEELELMPPDEKNPLLNGFAMFFSFVLFGLVPLIPFILFLMTEYGWEFHFFGNYFVNVELSITFALISLFTCGVLKTIFNVSAWWNSGLKMVTLGCLAFAVAFTFTSSFKHYTH